MIDQLPVLLALVEPLDLVVIDEDIGQRTGVKDELCSSRCVKHGLADVVTARVDDEDGAEPLRREAPRTIRRQHFELGAHIDEGVQLFHLGPVNLQAVRKVGGPPLIGLEV